MGQKEKAHCRKISVSSLAGDSVAAKTEIKIQGFLPVL